MDPRALNSFPEPIDHVKSLAVKLLTDVRKHKGELERGEV